MKKCLFAGSFDPFTLGHLEIVEKAKKSFDKVIVAIGENDQKTPYFSLKDRLKIINRIFVGDSKVTVTSYTGYTVDFMKSKDIMFTVRGIRDGKDLEYEMKMDAFNKERYPEIISLFYPIEDKFKGISSTKVKEIILDKGDLSGYMPESVIDLVYQILEEKTEE